LRIIPQLSNGRASERGNSFLHALLFVLGFSLVFIVGWGGAATLLGGLFGSYKVALGRIGGVLVIIFGLYTLGLLRVSWLGMDTRPSLLAKSSNRFLRSGLFGVFFAAGWTPCVGTTLGAILTLGFSQATSNQAMVLASGYAFGLGLPFLALALMLERALGLVSRLKKWVRTFQLVSGILLLIIGIMMLTDRITLIAIWAQRNGLYLDLPLGGASAPTYVAAVAAGLLSFLSPCVLPLVPAYLGYLSGERLLGQEPQVARSS